MIEVSVLERCMYQRDACTRYTQVAVLKESASIRVVSGLKLYLKSYALGWSMQERSVCIREDSVLDRYLY